MKPHRILYILTIFFLFTILFISCSSGNLPKSSSEWNLLPENFIFIEYYEQVEGSLLQGWYPEGIRIDGSDYFFRPDSAILIINKNDLPDLNSLKLLIGMNLSLSGKAGNGKRSIINCVDTLPFQKDSLWITNINSDGTAIIQLGKKTLQLKSGQEHTSTFTKTEFIEKGTQSGKVIFTTRKHIINHGIIQKSHIKNYNPKI